MFLPYRIIYSFPVKLFSAFILLALLIRPSFVYAQCPAAPIAATSCAVGTAVTNGANINSGQTYTFSGGPSTLSSVNMSGGTLRICGDLTLSGMNFNSGNLIIESGGKLTLNASVNAGGSIINRGTLIINGSLSMQGSVSALYNDLSTSVFTLQSGGTLTLSGSGASLVNRGVMTINFLLVQSSVGSVCVSNASIMTIGTLQNNTTNSFTYGGNGAPGCINVTTAAIMNNDVGGTSLVHICKGAGVTPTGAAAADASNGWGAAQVYSGCTSCATVLALRISQFTVTEKEGNISMQWTTGEPPAGNEVFYVEKSTDGRNFYTLTSYEARAGQTIYTSSDATADIGIQYYRIKMVSSAGATAYSEITAVEAAAYQPFWVYPNPVSPDKPITLYLYSEVTTTAEISLINMTGQAIDKRTIGLAKGKNSFNWGIRKLATGIYLIRMVTTPDNKVLYQRIAITSGY